MTIVCVGSMPQYITRLMSKEPDGLTKTERYILDDWITNLEQIDIVPEYARN